MDRYIMANISIPLKVNEDGTLTTMNDNIKMSFNSHELLDLAENIINSDYSSNELNELIAKMVPAKMIPAKMIQAKMIPAMTLLKSEIQPKGTMTKTRHMSFKNQNKSPNKTNRTTFKSR